MQSGIGDRAEVQRLGIPLVQYLSSMGHPSIFPGEGLPSATMILHSMRRGPATHIGHLHVIGGRFIQTCDRPASAERKINHNVQWKLCGSRSRSRKNFGPIEIEVHQIGVDQAAVDMPSLTNICRRINHAAACASLCLRCLEADTRLWLPSIRELEKTRFLSDRRSIAIRIANEPVWCRSSI